MRANEFVKKFGLDEAKAFLSFDSDVEIVYTASFFDDLKRLVESHELVGSYGGLESSKLTVNYPNFLNDEDVKAINHRLSKAIADVESCQ